VLLGGRAISMENSRLRRPAPTSVNVTVGRRGREYPTEREVERLIEAARQNRSGHRDATAILVAYRHGLRASELVALRWDDIDLTNGRLSLQRRQTATAEAPFPALTSGCLYQRLNDRESGCAVEPSSPSPALRTP